MKSVAQLCAEWGLHEHMDAPERWLTKQITDKRITARKIGRKWLFTPADEAAALAAFKSAAVRRAAPEAPEDVTTHGLSARSARRRMALVGDEAAS